MSEVNSKTDRPGNGLAEKPTRWGSFIGCVVLLPLGVGILMAQPTEREILDLVFRHNSEAVLLAAKIQGLIAGIAFFFGFRLLHRFFFN